MSMKTVSSSIRPEPWNKGRLIGQKRPLKPKEVWAIRVRLEIGGTKRNLALFNPAIDSKLRACGRPVQFEITEATREAVQSWISIRGLRSGFLFSSRQHDSLHLSTRQYARIVDSWVKRAGLDSAAYGTHSMRRTKAAQIYRKTANLRAVQLLLGHTKLESTVRYLGIEVDDALSISEQIKL